MSFQVTPESLCALASYQLTPMLTFHGLVSLYVLISKYRHYSDLRHWTDDNGSLAVWVCVLPLYHYCLDMLCLGMHLKRQFTSVAYYVHHVFGVHMILCGFQARLANFSTLQMQLSHGFLIFSFLLPPYIQVTACHYYYFSGIFLVFHHFIGIFTQKEWKLQGIGMVFSGIVMGLLKNQVEIFGVCEVLQTFSNTEVVIQAILATFEAIGPNLPVIFEISQIFSERIQVFDLSSGLFSQRIVPSALFYECQD